MRVQTSAHQISSRGKAESLCESPGEIWRIQTCSCLSMRFLEHRSRTEVVRPATELESNLPAIFWFRHGRVEEIDRARENRSDTDVTVRHPRAFQKHRSIAASQKNGAMAQARPDLRPAAHNACRIAAQSEGRRARRS